LIATRFGVIAFVVDAFPSPSIEASVDLSLFGQFMEDVSTSCRCVFFEPNHPPPDTGAAMAVTRTVEVVTELLLVVLSIIAAPSELKEFRVDSIHQSGRVESMVVHRTVGGFMLHLQQGDQLVEKGSIRQVAGKPAAFVLKMGDAPEQVVDLRVGIPDFNVADLEKSKELDLKTSDGKTIHVHRSGSAVYLTPEGTGVTVACH
jgi:hypothetical protein